jgi:hypothetical protein
VCSNNITDRWGCRAKIGRKWVASHEADYTLGIYGIDDSLIFRLFNGVLLSNSSEQAKHNSLARR